MYRLPPSFIRTLAVLPLLFATPALVLSHGGVDDGDEISPSPAASASDALAADNTYKVRLAFGLTAIAAVAACIGALIPFSAPLLRRIPGVRKDIDPAQSPTFIAAALAFSSGILMFLSLGDLYPEAVAGWAGSGWVAKKHAAIIVLAEMVGVFGLILGGKRLWAWWQQRRRASAYAAKTADVENTGSQSAKVAVTGCDEAAANPATDNISETLAPKRSMAAAACSCPHNGEDCVDFNGNPAPCSGACCDSDPKATIKSQLGGSGYAIAAAIAMHNIPEGLVTFTTTVASARLGVIFAIALALHKIPEGVLVSLPIYLATGSKLRAILIACIAGAGFQMLGALIGYALFVTLWNQALSGLIFGLVMPVLIVVVIGGMLPAARRYDPADRVVTLGVSAGVIFFAFVTALFSYA